ncbi:hypothetical protein [Aquabacterium sp.]|uniref:hypothetical protein n=1 Tax=Aquabacterium sp. TaxID=1872578 RepID=UPI003D6D04A3
MSDLSANLPQIISAAAQSQLGILALLSVALSVLAYFFFSTASEKVKVGIFAMLFVGVIGFGVAMFRTPPSSSPQVSSTPSSTDTGRSEASGSAVAATVPQPQTPATPATDDAFTGHWSGQARDTEGTVFQVDVRIDRPCTPGQPCGSIRVSHVPCQGELTLEQVKNGDHEFSVDHFSGDSAASCTKGAGEHFRRQADGSLLYTTSYEPKAHAVLVKKP